MTIFRSADLSCRKTFPWNNGILLLIFLQFATGPLGAQSSGAETTPTVTVDEKHQERTTPTESQPELDRFDRAHFNNESASHYSYPTSQRDAAVAPSFFPPVPPALEEEPPLLPPFTNGVPAPAELAPFTGDWFYSLLGARLIADDLPKSVRAQLQAYRSAKLELQNELRAQLVTLKGATPAWRATELAALASRQQPRLAALENTAEKIRADLRRTDFMGAPVGNVDWAALVPRLQKSAEASDARLEAFVLRGAAFYQDGISPAQRTLLLEQAIETEAKFNSTAPSALPNQDVWVLSLSPETARIRLAANLPAALAQKISEYTSAKQNLKIELREALFASASTSNPARVGRLKELAVAQAPRLAALEIAAEEIRGELAALPNPPGPPAPLSLPPELAARITAYRAHKLELLKTLYALLAGHAKSVESTGGTRPWMRDEITQTEVKPEQSKLSTLEFNNVQTRLLAELNQEQAGIREALAEHFRATNQPTDRKSINDLLKDFETARQKQEIWEKYRDYQNAVLLPGLSPEQRRLLFDAAIEQLALPLPAGEKIP